MVDDMAMVGRWRRDLKLVRGIFPGREAAQSRGVESLTWLGGGRAVGCLSRRWLPVCFLQDFVSLVNGR